MTPWLSRAAAVTVFNLRSLRRRPGAAVVTVVGIAGVVAVFIAVLSIGEGFRAALSGSGAGDVAIVFRGGTDTERNSSLSRDEVAVIAAAPGLARREGKPLASAEVFVAVDLPRRGSGTPAMVPLRGVGPLAPEVRDGFAIVAGRPFRPGARELIVGTRAARAFSGLDVGSTLSWDGNAWTVVGHFTAEGVARSEIWCDLRMLMPLYRRTTFQAVYTRLASPADLERLDAHLAADPRLDVDVVRESDYYRQQSESMGERTRRMGSLVAALMGIAAIFAALNTMHSAVSARRRELATLRALGFSGGTLAVSILAEALVLGLLGGLAGAVGAFVGFDGFHASTLNFQSMSQVAFAFAVTPPLALRGALYGLGVALLGGLPAAVGALRLPVARQLRES